MNKKELWQAILGEMELLISKPNFTTWFKRTDIHSYNDNSIVISVPNAFTKSWFERKYHSLISKALLNITEKPNIKITYIITANSPTLTEEKKDHIVQKSISPKINNFFSNGINLKYTFENFITGKGNELAQAASLAIVEKPGETYNPLFIYGNVGLGKTHLMQAIGNEILKKYPDKKVLYIPCEKFVNDFIQSISLNKTVNFKEKYRQIDVLLVDDIQFLSGKEQTQEAFFHTFNELHQQNKQIVLSSDRPPKSIATLEDRLISRFEWGMIADVSAPDLETRIAILQYKAQEKNFSLNSDIINFLATNIRSNVRELEGILNKIIAYSQINNFSPTIENVQQILSNLKRTPHSSSLGIKTLFKTITDFFNISEKELISSCRKKHLVIPRQITMYIMRTEMKKSYPTIGQELGGRDHTTAMYACLKIEKEKEKNNDLYQNIEEIKQKLYNNF